MGKLRLENVKKLSTVSRFLSSRDRTWEAEGEAQRGL